jgi:hypothetical protein
MQPDRYERRISISFVDLAAISSAFDRVRCVLMSLFLVRNWGGPASHASMPIGVGFRCRGRNRKYLEEWIIASAMAPSRLCGSSGGAMLGGATRQLAIVRGVLSISGSGEPTR